MKLEIKKLSSEAKLPCFAHKNDAGMDMFASESLVIPPKTRATVATGIAMKIPEGHVGLIWDKSGLASKKGITLLGGVIDSGYRGEIKIIVKNLGDEPYSVEVGNKIGQMLIQVIHQPEIVEVESLDESSRGDGGFGSTGER